MFRLIYLIPMLLTGIFVASCSSAKAVADDAPRENLIIYYDPAVGNAALLESAKNYGSEVIYIYKNINGIAVTVPAGRTVSAAKEYYGSICGVLTVTEDCKQQVD